MWLNWILPLCTKWFSYFFLKNCGLYTVWTEVLLDGAESRKVEWHRLVDTKGASYTVGMYDRIYYIKRIIRHSVVAKNHIVLYEKLCVDYTKLYHTIRYGSWQPHCEVLYALCNKFYHTYLVNYYVCIIYALRTLLKTLLY